LGFLLNLANKELSLKTLISLGLIDPSAPEIDTPDTPITLAELYAELTDVQNDSTGPVGPLKRKTTVQLYAKEVELYDPSATEMIDTLVSPITLAQLSPELTDVQNDSTDPVGPLTRKSTFRLYAKKVELDTGNPVIRNRRSTFSIYAGSSLRG